MAPKCTVCGADGAPPHVCAGDLEQTYDRDLRSLADRTRETLASLPQPDAVGLDAPASVREAIRLTDTLSPVAPPEPAPPSVPALAVVTPTRGTRRAVVAVVLGGALTGSLVWLAEVCAPAAPEIAPSVVDALRLAEPEAPARVVPVVTTAVPARVVVAPPVATPRRPLVSRPRPSSTAAPSVAPAEPPTLMQAITASVRARPGAEAAPAAPQGAGAALSRKP